MKKWIFLLLLISESATAENWISTCQKITHLDAWQDGSDKYGLRVRLDSPVHQNCEAGFYIPHEGENKKYVYSTLLSALTADRTVCVQYKVSENIDNEVCKVNQITLKK